MADEQESLLAPPNMESTNSASGDIRQTLVIRGRDWRLFNVVILGFAFMLMFTAFQTCAMVEESVLEGAKNETNGTFTGTGYTSLAIIYGSFSLFNWIAPSIVAVTGPRIAMVLGGTTYGLFIATFLKPMTWALYTASALVGLGAAVIWTGQGNYLTLNSDSETIGRNSGIFWALLQCSLLFGNLYVYFAFKGEVVIEDHSRTTVFLVLTVTCALGILLLFVLRKPRQVDADNLLTFSTRNEETAPPRGPLYALKRSGQLLCTKEMILLCVTFAYTGFELTFFSGVYGTCVGHNQSFGNEAKALIGIVGMFIGVGEIIGGATFGLFGKRTNKYGRDPIVLLGFVVHIIAFYLIFINLPMRSPIDDKDAATYITSNKYIAILCGFLLGLGDACFNTQIYSLLGFLWIEDSAPAFALFKFVQSLAAAGGFFYSNQLLLQWQLLLLVIMATLGSWTFCIVEWQARKKFKGGFQRIG